MSLLNKIKFTVRTANSRRQFIFGRASSHGQLSSRSWTINVSAVEFGVLLKNARNTNFTWYIFFRPVEIILFVPKAPPMIHFCDQFIKNTLGERASFFVALRQNCGFSNRIYVRLTLRNLLKKVTLTLRVFLINSLKRYILEGVFETYEIMLAFSI